MNSETVWTWNKAVAVLWAEMKAEGWLDLTRADLTEADLTRADLTEANLTGADLTRADLTEADLTEANLSWANLSRADLTGADLSRADLSWANLTGANLSRADLSWADLTGADLSRADLTRADLSWAGLDNKKHIYSITGPGSSRRMTTYYVETDTVWCGCFAGTLEQFTAQVERTHKNNAQWLAEYHAVIAFFTAMKNMAGEQE
jgi:uncharacterized protein YjbI with pentapeptide repeats